MAQHQKTLLLIQEQQQLPSTAMKSKSKWVINMSKKPLTESQLKLLAHGPNYVVTPRNPPIGEYIAAVENTCQSLTQGEADEMRAEIKAAIKRSHPSGSNITREEQRALRELKKEDTRVILTADKGVCLVVLDKDEYIRKAEEILEEKTYKVISTDPTNRQRNRLIQILKKIKEEEGMNETPYKKVYATGAGIPMFYGLPKIHKAGVPLRPIVSSRGSVSYNTAKELVRILKPLAGRTIYTVHNAQDFAEQMKTIKLLPDECIMSYDVKALFTSVPIEPAIKIIKQHLKNDKELEQRTSMSVQHIIILLEFCLKNTHFIFQDRFYDQTEGAAMSSSLSPIIANLYMEAFVEKAINTTPTPTSLWRRFVDDTFVIIKKTQKESFISHINSIDEIIQFIMEDSRDDGSMPFFDTLVIPCSDGSLSAKVYRKPTHTDLYLQWDSHHTIAAKYSVVSTLHHRCKAVCSTQQLLDEEENHLQKVLTENKYPNWALNRVKNKIKATTKQDLKRREHTSNIKGWNKPYMILPYFRGLSESMKNICNKHGVQVHYRGGNTIKGLLMAPKDADHITMKNGIIYRFKCQRVECDDEYIGESSRTFGERFKEHLKAPSPIYYYQNITGHDTTIDNFSIVGSEDQNLIRAIKEAVYIRVNNPSLNSNIGKYQLPHIWDEVLNNIPELKLK